MSLDSLGKSKRGANVFDMANVVARGYVASASSGAGVHRVEYRRLHQDRSATPAWTIEFSDRKIVLISQWSDDVPGEPMTFHFDLNSCHSTVLGILKEKNQLRLPALMHCPTQGSMRITTDATSDLTLAYASQKTPALATLAFPPATEGRKCIVYTLEVVAIYPDLAGIRGDDRFDPFRRNWLNGLQLDPTNGVLSNNTASDSCALCYYEFADIASPTPALADGLIALDLVRQTLDYILEGGTAYGFPGPGDFPTKSAYPAQPRTRCPRC